MLAVTATTGDITSILFGIPGEPTTARDDRGRPRDGQERQGRARARRRDDELARRRGLRRPRARLAIPIIRPLVLTLGSPEFFMLAVLGITFVASLSGEALVKGTPWPAASASGWPRSASTR